MSEQLHPLNVDHPSTPERLPPSPTSPSGEMVPPPSRGRFDVMQNGQPVSILNPVQPPGRDLWAERINDLFVLADAALSRADAAVMAGRGGDYDPSGDDWLRRRSPEYMDEHWPEDDRPPGSPSPESRGHTSDRPNRGRHSLDSLRRRSAPVPVPAPAPAPAFAPAPASVPAVGRARPRVVECGVNGCPRMFSSKNIADHRKTHVLEGAGGSQQARQPCKPCARNGKACMVSTSPANVAVNTYSCLACLKSHRGCSHKEYGRAQPRPRRHPALDSPSQ